MYRLDIKPLSVNDALSVFRGMKIKTKKYREYEQLCFTLLPKLNISSEKLFLKLRFGYSRKTSDLDNCVKPFLDILQKAYEFDDKMVYRMEVEKIDVRKGEEFIEFNVDNFVDM